ncbi:MAG: reverse transcriptase/maturase family protein [archaeon]|nr:reverse transcriptase/maturase family protein [archaeon]
MSSLNGNYNGNRLNVNGNNFDDNNNNGYAFGMALGLRQFYMKTNNNLYEEICSINNLILAWRKARKHKTKKDYVKEFEKDTLGSLLKLQKELLEQTYSPQPLVTFILRDPKTRKISKSAFRDRIIHHAIVNIIEPIFDKRFIYDSCANRIGKGNLFALKRFDEFKRKVSQNNTRECFVLKADIKHYFQEVNHEVLLKIIERRMNDKEVICLIKKILANLAVNRGGERQKSMPLGNLTSQFFANVYLNELDYFIKHKLKVKYYLRYVDDFVILHENKEQIKEWKEQIDEFLRNCLKIELHPDKSRIILLSQGVDFVGFKNSYYFKLLRRRNVNNMKRKVEMFKQSLLTKEKFLESFNGWNAYAKWANTFKLRKRLLSLSSQ